MSEVSMLFRERHPTTQHGIQPNAIFNVYAELESDRERRPEVLHDQATTA
jgi:hypothetical protein